MFIEEQINRLGMSEFQEEIKFYANEGDSIFNITEFSQHLFLADDNKRNKMEAGELVLKKADGKKLKLVIWETQRDDGPCVKFYGYTGFVWYGSGAYGNGKSGFGMTLAYGYVKFDSNGKGTICNISKMADGKYHR